MRRCARIPWPPPGAVACAPRRGTGYRCAFKLRLLSVVTLGLVACGDGITPPTAELAIMPEQVNDGWRVGEASQVGMNAELLKDLFNAIKRDDFKDIDGIVIAKSGQLVFEAYFHGYSRDKRHDLRSATKSLTSALIGIAVDREHVAGVAAPVYPALEAYAPFDRWSAQKEDIAAGHLLTMTPGWDCDDANSASPGQEDKMYEEDDWVRFMLDLPMKNTPGAVYAYCTGGAVVLGELLKAASGMPVDDFAERYLFTPLGITNYNWEYTPVGQVDTGGHIWMTPRDMAKVGQLFLQRGSWDGEQIISSGWVDESTSLQLMGGDSEFGYLWWRETRDVNGRSFTIHSASGNGGQRIFVVPSADLVVTLTGSHYNTPLWVQPGQIMGQYVLKAIE